MKCSTYGREQAYKENSITEETATQGMLIKPEALKSRGINTTNRKARERDDT
jgi:hypothetical protein